MLIAGVVGVVVGGVGFVVAKKLFGRKVFIYGTKASGKTTFKTYCKKRITDTTYSPTQRKETAWCWRRLDSWRIVDTVGQDYRNLHLKDIREDIKKSDIILYFFRADQLAAPDTTKKTLRTINANIQQYKDDLKGKKLIVIATHMDKVPNFSKSEWENENIIKNIITLTKDKRIEYVSLLPEKIKESCTQILEAMKQ